MANFFLIDHSLQKTGGHHFDYARCVAKAANELGFLTTIGANREFGRRTSKQSESLEQFGSVRRVFRQTTYQRDSYLAGLQHLTRSDSRDLLCEDFNLRRVNRYWNGIKRFQHRRRREKFVRHFASDCERYFRPLMQTQGDHAFFTTVSELELMGLAVYLSSHSKTLQTHWHLQFHYNLFDGRTPEYEGQAYLSSAVRACFLAALARLSYHSVHFYTTSQTLADQYNRLGVGEFQHLPYPVSREFASAEIVRSEMAKPAESPLPALSFGEFDLANAIKRSEKSSVTPPGIRYRESDQDLAFEFANEDEFDNADSPNSADPTILPISMFTSDSNGAEVSRSSSRQSHDHFRKPLRITCPGEVRREKGHVEYLQPLVDEIWPTHLATGNVQVVVQRPAKKWHSKKQKIELSLPETPADPNCQPVEYFSHPLSHEDYVELIKSTDCGLLFYDSRVYFSRRAGVLGELLSCGKPVIVPAGSWLAEQIQEPIFKQADSLLRSGTVGRELSLSDFKWNSKNVPNTGGVLSFDQTNHPFELTVERYSGESSFIMQFDWHWPKSTGIYCRIDVSQIDDAGDIIQESSRVIGGRRTDNQPNSIFHLQTETKTVKFSISNAFHHSTASIKRVKIHTLTSDSDSDSHELPIGQVGVIASDQADLANCVDEIVKHYDHYSDTAASFSKQWYALHEPTRTVGHLVSVGESMMQRAA